jgi:small subunit ribosomal protein S14
MAKRNMINRELKRIQLTAKYAKKRAALKETIRDPQSTMASW